MSKSEKVEMNAWRLIRIAAITISFIVVLSIKYELGLYMAQTTEPPVVVEAVAPQFIPFVFGETGVNEVAIEVTIDSTGKVTSTKTIHATLFKDASFEATAKRWRFAPLSDAKEDRIARIKFTLRIMPKDTPPDQLTTIYTAPDQIEVRHEVFDPHITSAPIPDELKNGQPKKKRK